MAREEQMSLQTPHSFPLPARSSRPRRVRAVNTRTAVPLHTQTHTLQMDAAAFGLADEPPGGDDSAPSAAASVPPAPAPLREDMVENAVGFLVHPKVRGACVCMQTLGTQEGREREGAVAGERAGPTPRSAGNASQPRPSPLLSSPPLSLPAL